MKHLTRVAKIVVLLYIAVAIYAPFLASGQPIFTVWKGHIYFPLIRDLLTAPRPIDLFFNLLALTLPVGLLLCRWRPWGPLSVAVAHCLLFGLLLAMPMRPGNEPLHQATSFWRDRVHHEQMERKYGAAYLARYHDALPTPWNRRIATQAQGVASWRARGDAWSMERAQILERRWQQLEADSQQLRFVLMPLLRPFDAYEEAGGSQHLNRIVKWTDLTRLNRRDLVASLLYGTRVSLVVGLGAVLLSLIVAIPLGALAGYWGRAWDLTLSRLIEIWEALPLFFMLLLAMAFFQTKSLLLTTLVTGLFGWTALSRYVRAEVARQRSQSYVDAARGFGFSHLRILFTHVLPNSLSPLIALAPFAIMAAIAAEAGLSFLGLGDEECVSWGILMHEGRVSFPAESHLLWPPAIALALLLIAIALLGDALRDRLDPRLAK
jgi:peptide/nickel transport system permease protein